MFCYLLAPASNNNDLNDDEAFHTVLQPALRKLKMCESNERLAVLALAVWKAQCVVDMPKDDVKDAYLAAMEWARKGWKSRKQEQRNANAIDTVVLAVKPFLFDSNA